MTTSQRSAKKRNVAAALAVSLTLFATGCSQVVNPATGETEFTSLDRAQEAALGRQEHPKVLAQFGGEYSDPDLRRYVQQLGLTIQSHSELAEDDFTFTLLDSPVVNAFALPGGFVYLSRGLLALANNEAELAGVVAHEIGHVTGRHSAKNLDRQQQGALAQAAASILGAILLGEAGAQIGQQLGGVGAAAFVQSFSREQEFEADDLGVRYMSRAGYDPFAMASFLSQLGASSALDRRIAGVEGDPAASWFSTHPRSEDRVLRASARAQEAERATRLERGRFLDVIDGMVYGDSPAQGYVRGQEFVHTELRFAFEAPSGWRLINQPNAVLGRGPNSGVLRFDMDEVSTRRSLADYVANDWAKGADIRDLRSFRAQAGEAQSGVGQVTIGGQRRDALFAAVRGPDDRVYRFLYASGGSIARARRGFEDAIARTRNLSAAEARRYQPLRIRVVEVRAGERIADFARRMAVENEPEARFMVLNDLEPGERLEPGQRVKIIVEG